MLLKSLLAAPGSFAKTVPLLSAAGATQVQQIFASFFFSSPSSCPVAIKRPVYYETWPPCHCCYWLCGSQPQARAHTDPKPSPALQSPCLPHRHRGPQVQRGQGGTCAHTVSGLHRLLPLGARVLQEEQGEPQGTPPLFSCPGWASSLHQREKVFFFPQTKINKQKNTPGSLAWATLGLARCCLLPLTETAGPSSLLVSSGCVQ